MEGLTGSAAALPAPGFARVPFYRRSDTVLHRRKEERGVTLRQTAGTGGRRARPRSDGDGAGMGWSQRDLGPPAVGAPCSKVNPQPIPFRRSLYPSGIPKRSSQAAIRKHTCRGHPKRAPRHVLWSLPSPATADKDTIEKGEPEKMPAKATSLRGEGNRSRRRATRQGRRPPPSCRWSARSGARTQAWGRDRSGGSDRALSAP